METKLFKIIHLGLTSRTIYYVIALNEDDAVKLCQKEDNRISKDDTILEIGNHRSVLFREEID